MKLLYIPYVLIYLGDLFAGYDKYRILIISRIVSKTTSILRPVVELSVAASLELQIL